MVNFGEKANSYVVIIGNLQGSREMEHRAQVQRRLLETIERINADSHKSFLAPVTLTSGDEVQCILSSWPALVNYIVALSDAMFPHNFYIGVGCGSLTTDMQPEVGLMDGPCFHLARDALDEVKSQSGWAVFRGFGAGPDAILTALFRLMGVVRTSWTEKQGLYCIASRHMKQKDVASDYQVSPSVVSESLKAARFEDLQAAEEAAKILLTALEQPSR